MLSKEKKLYRAYKEYYVHLFQGKAKSILTNFSSQRRICYFVSTVSLNRSFKLVLEFNNCTKFLNSLLASLLLLFDKFFDYNVIKNISLLKRPFLGATLLATKVSYE